ncbi:2-oxoglutarate-acceptor oxidoreductase subunit OorD [bacterium BMS3Abin14]|nr:2-oxoglutarate-acceptor oxidoreductase subunit OorD [bacterium BMS3Abin14]
MANIAPDEKTEVAQYGGRKITIIPRYCKGCEICVKFCPASVLEMKDFKVHTARIEDCTECMLCEVRCPDFAIFVDESGKKGKAK